MTAPVIMRDSSDAKKSTMLARSSGSPIANGCVVNPIAFAAAGVALLVVGLAAAFVPALRAGMADPLIALREQ